MPARGSQSEPLFTLVTGNQNKRVEVERLLGVEIRSEAVDLPEIQSLDVAEILEAKGEEAFSRLVRPVVVEETSLECEGLNGFPGPLVKWMLESMGAGAMACLLTTAKSESGQPLNTRVTARCSVLYRCRDRQVTAEGTTSGHLVYPPRGQAGFGWDPVFEPDGYQQTYGQLSAETKDEIGHRGRAFRALLLALDQAETS